jgi:hypothetical protein
VGQSAVWPQNTKCYGKKEADIHPGKETQQEPGITTYAMLGWGVSGEISFPSHDWSLALDATARRRIAEAKACDMRIISNEKLLI